MARYAHRRSEASIRHFVASGPRKEGRYGPPRSRQWFALVAVRREEWFCAKRLDDLGGWIAEVRRFGRWYVLRRDALDGSMRYGSTILTVGSLRIDDLDAWTATARRAERPYAWLDDERTVENVAPHGEFIRVRSGAWVGEPLLRACIAARVRLESAR